MYVHLTCLIHWPGGGLDSGSGRKVDDVTERYRRLVRDGGGAEETARTARAQVHGTRGDGGGELRYIHVHVGDVVYATYAKLRHIHADDVV